MGVDLHRDHKLIINVEGAWLYPVPVVEDAKYLIQVPRPEIGEMLKKLFAAKDPIVEPESFTFSRTHRDAVTPIYVIQPELVEHLERLVQENSL